MKILKYFIIVLIVVLILVLVAGIVLVQKPKPKTISYGMSFNTVYARELGLDWQEAYQAIIHELGVRQFRLAAHWPMVEPAPGVYNFSELDYQIEEAGKADATVILAVGRRLPRWPECHIPSWARERTWEENKASLKDYMTAVVERYKDNPTVTIWQVENEPFLEVFAFEHCGELDEDFLYEQIALVKELDPTRPILVTDSGNLGTWSGAYQAGDIFGTSVYVHFWNPELGQFRTFLPSWFYPLKENIVKLRHGEKPTVLIELSAEPWLLAPIVEVPLEVQFTRMNPGKFSDILEYARGTRYDQQYLWGAEWWYWLHLQGESDMWELGKELFSASTILSLVNEE
ncbi:MAG: beta-galactosidase [Candidatus Paceibacteria bacterium]